MNKTTLTIVLVLFFGLFLGQNAMAQQAVKAKITSEKEVKVSTADKDVNQSKPQLQDSKSATQQAKPCCNKTKVTEVKKDDSSKSSSKCCSKTKKECPKAKECSKTQATEKK